MSARSIATRLGASVNTVTSRLEEAGYNYILGEWKNESKARHILKVGTLHLDLLDHNDKYEFNGRFYKIKDLVDIPQQILKRHS
jgi:hypothetical protein